MKLGKKPARAGAIQFAFADIFDASKLPKPPAAFGHYGVMPEDQWGVLGNDNYSDCVFAGAAHEHMLWTLIGAGRHANFTTENVLSDYSAVTGFDPQRPETDDGADMQMAAEYRQKIGILDSIGQRHKIDLYVALEPGNVEELALATWLFGACGIGVETPSNVIDLFDRHRPWSVADSSRNLEGGHYVPFEGRLSSGEFICVTWGRTQLVLPDFVEKFMDEGVAYLSLEYLDPRKLSPEGFNAEQLGDYLREVGR